MSTISQLYQPDIVVLILYSNMKMYFNPVHLLTPEPLDKVTIIVTSSSHKLEMQGFERQGHST